MDTSNSRSSVDTASCRSSVWQIQWDPRALKNENEYETLQAMFQAAYSDAIVVLDNTGMETIRAVMNMNIRILEYLNKMTLEYYLYSYLCHFPSTNIFGYSFLDL